MKPSRVKDTIAKLQTDLADSGTIKRPTIEPYSPLDTKKVSRKMKLASRGTERGSQDFPRTEDDGPDEVETEIIQFLQADIQKTKEQFEDSQSTYENRFYRSYNIMEYGMIETEARNSISEFKKSVDDGLSQLQISSERLRETADERRLFRKKNKLERTAHYPNSGVVFFRWSLVLLLFLIESLANANFLAKGNDYGLIGGWVEAIAISFMNIGAALVVGLFVTREMWHRNILRKLWGFIVTCSWIAFTLAFNLLVAHYRETSGIITEVAGFVFSEFTVNPLGIEDFQSWMLFGIGVLFAVITMLDALTMDDLYPFYGKLDRKYEDLRNEYSEHRSRLIEKLDETRTDSVESLKEASAEMDKHSSDRKTILVDCEEEQRKFKDYLKKCNLVCKKLLEIYRDANRMSRSEPAPAHFTSTYEFDDLEYYIFLPDPDYSNNNIDRFQNNLREVIKEFFTAFEDAVQSYPQLSEITQDSNEAKTA